MCFREADRVRRVREESVRDEYGLSETGHQHRENLRAVSAHTGVYVNTHRCVCERAHRHVSAVLNGPAGCKLSAELHALCLLSDDQAGLMWQEAGSV